MERFSRVYSYPYGSSYLSSYLYEPGREIMENQSFERILQGEREMRPFHVACPITNRKICYCEKRNQGLLSSPGYRKMAYELQLHYEGYPEDILERVRDKMQFERERLQNISQKEFVAPFDKFIEFPEEPE